MKGSLWRPFVAVLLVASLGANLWLGLKLNRNAAQVRQGAAYLSWGANYALNGIVRMIDDPAADWDSPGFRASLLELFEWATLYAQTAGSTVSGNTTGPYHQVATHLNGLSFEFSDHRAAVMRMASAPGPVSAEHKQQLRSFAANLRKAGWPRNPVSRDDTAGWTAFAEALGNLHKLETTGP